MVGRSGLGIKINLTGIRIIGVFGGGVGGAIVIIGGDQGQIGISQTQGAGGVNSEHGIKTAPEGVKFRRTGERRGPNIPDTFIHGGRIIERNVSWFIGFQGGARIGTGHRPGNGREGDGIGEHVIGRLGPTG